MSLAYRHRIALRVEQLEERLTPVIGGSAVPDALPHHLYTGVVALARPGFFGNEVAGTGALLWTGQHIITAAHLFDGNGDRKVDKEGKWDLDEKTQDWLVVFNLPSGRREIPVRVSEANLWLPAIWDRSLPMNSPWSALRGGDIAIITLPYQAPLEDPNAGILGAERYTIYNNSWGGDLGRVFDFVGYGITGTGATGFTRGTRPSEQRRLIRNRFDGDPAFNPLNDEVQVVSINLSRRPTFRLHYRDAQGVQTTKRLTWQTSARQMERAFERLARLEPGDVRVTRQDYKLPGKPKQRSWFIHFTSFWPQHQIGGSNIQPLTATPRSAVRVSTALEGGQSTRLRLPILLAYDFDNGLPQHDAMGLFFGFRDLGVTGEGMPYVGDSGGPAFLRDAAGNPVIAAIQSGTGPQDQNNRPPDIDSGLSPTEMGNQVPVNGSFGEIGYMTRLNASHGGIYIPELKYEWVLDMNHQPWGNDGKDDFLEIRRNGFDAEVVVNDILIKVLDSDAQIFQRPRLTAIRIIGSPDSETIEVEHPRIHNLELSIDLGEGDDDITLKSLPFLHKPVQINGGAGNDKLTIYASGGEIGGRVNHEGIEQLIINDDDSLNDA